MSATDMTARPGASVLARGEPAEGCAGIEGAGLAGARAAGGLVTGDVPTGAPTTSTPAVDAPRITRLVTAADRVRVFRRVLEVLAEPGEVRELAPLFAGRDDPAGCSVTAAPLLVLADGMSPIAALRDDDTAAREVDILSTVTHAPVVEMGQARFVLATAPVEPAALSDLYRGTREVPEKAALLVVGVPHLGPGAREAANAGAPNAEGPEVTAPDSHGPDADGPHASAQHLHRLRLAGPGVDGHRDLLVGGLAPLFWHARAAAIDYPLGIDLLLVDRAGRVAGVPRTTRVEVVTEREVVNGQGSTNAGATTEPTTSERAALTDDVDRNGTAATAGEARA